MRMHPPRLRLPQAQRWGNDLVRRLTQKHGTPDTYQAATAQASASFMSAAATCFGLKVHVALSSRVRSNMLTNLAVCSLSPRVRSNMFAKFIDTVAVCMNLANMFVGVLRCGLFGFDRAHVPSVCVANEERAIHKRPLACKHWLQRVVIPEGIKNLDARPQSGG